MLFNDKDEDGQHDKEHIQLSFPFQVQRIELPPQPNQYSLAPIDDGCLEGGGFFYENCSKIFLRRSGYGPLRIAWDTNILIDYAEFGDLIWGQKIMKNTNSILLSRRLVTAKNWCRCIG